MALDIAVPVVVASALTKEGVDICTLVKRKRDANVVIQKLDTLDCKATMRCCVVSLGIAPPNHTDAVNVQERIAEARQYKHDS